MHALEPHSNDIAIIYRYFNIKSDRFWNFENVKFHQNIPQNAPNYII